MLEFFPIKGLSMLKLCIFGVLFLYVIDLGISSCLSNQFENERKLCTNFSTTKINNNWIMKLINQWLYKQDILWRTNQWNTHGNLQIVLVSKPTIHWSECRINCSWCSQDFKISMKNPEIGTSKWRMQFQSQVMQGNKEDNDVQVRFSKL